MQVVGLHVRMKRTDSSESSMAVKRRQEGRSVGRCHARGGEVVPSDSRSGERAPQRATVSLVGRVKGCAQLLWRFSPCSRSVGDGEAASCTFTLGPRPPHLASPPRRRGTVDLPPASACAADRSHPIDQLPTTARIAHPIESTATALQAGTVLLLQFRTRALVPCAPCERRRATTASLRVQFGFREALIGNSCIGCLPAIVAGRPSVRLSHHGSISNTKDKVDEPLHSCQIVCCLAMGGLPAWHVGANIWRHRQRLTAEVRKALCNQDIPTLQVVVLLDLAVTAIGQLVELHQTIRVRSMWSIDIVAASVHRRRR